MGLVCTPLPFIDRTRNLPYGPNPYLTTPTGRVRTHTYHAFKPLRNKCFRDSLSQVGEKVDLRLPQVKKTEETFRLGWYAAAWGASPKTFRLIWYAAAGAPPSTRLKSPTAAASREKCKKIRVRQSTISKDCVTKNTKHVFKTDNFH